MVVQILKRTVLPPIWLGSGATRTGCRGAAKGSQGAMGEIDFDATTAIGLVAAVLTTAAFLPQVIKTWRTRKTRDISLGMFLVLCLGICLWLVYGLLRGDLPLILANAVTLALAGTILVFKLKYK